MLWSNSETDIETKLKLKLGFEQAKFTQGYQVIASIASAIFGGKKPEAAKNMQDAMTQFEGVFGK